MPTSPEPAKSEPEAPDPNVEVAATNAELAEAHAETAAKEAEKAERELAEAKKEKRGSRLCPHDNTEMTQHDDRNPAKAGAWHCDTCGCCFKGRELREGHPPCPAGATA